MITSERFHHELAMITLYPDAFRKEFAAFHGEWGFSYLLCNTWWKSSGFCRNDFSSLFSCSGRMLEFSSEHQSTTVQSGKGDFPDETIDENQIT